MFRKILSIDIGVHNLGLSYSLLGEDFTFERVVSIDLVDMTHFKHKKVPLEECKLYHSKTFCDWTNHIIQENKEMFDEAETILIERQPPFSAFTAIEQLIFDKFRAKTHLINPCSVHKHLSMRHLSYDLRKEKTVRITSQVLNEELLGQFESYERKHDIGDSVAQMLYWSEIKNWEYRVKERKRCSEYRDRDIFTYLESFRYIEKK